MGGYLLGADPTDIDGIQSLLKQAGYLGWRNFWIEPACWDIIGKSRNKPVYELLGGKARPMEVYCSTGEMHDPERRVDELLAMRDRGFKTAKLRVKNRALEDDVRHVAVIRKGVGGKLALGVDANQGWLVTIVDKIPPWDLTRAEAFAKACEEHNIVWLEEPLDSRDYDGNAALRKGTRVKISGAELNYGWDEIKIMFEKECFDIYQPDATFAGGIAQVKRVIDECRKRDLQVFAPHLDQRYRVLRELEHGPGRPEKRIFRLNTPLRSPRGCRNSGRGSSRPSFPVQTGCLSPLRDPGWGLRSTRGS